MSESLYKYQPDNVYTVENILKNQLYLSSPLSFNDPYDIPEIFLGSAIGDGRKLINSEIEPLLQGVEDRGTISTKQLAILKEMHEVIKNDPKINEYKAEILIDKLLKCALRVCSFSQQSPRFDSIEEIGYAIPMFSYYGDSHKGLVIQYDKDTVNESLSARMFLDYVEYPFNGVAVKTPDEQHTYPVSLDIEDLKMLKKIIEAGEKDSISDEQKSLIKKIIFRKKKCWEHEDEWRVASVSIEKSISLKSNRSIKAVYFGERMSLARKQFYKEILHHKYKKAKIYCCTTRQNTVETKDSMRIIECRLNKPCKYCEWQKTSGIWACSLNE